MGLPPMLPSFNRKASNMTEITLPKSHTPARSMRWIGIAAAVVLVGAMAFDTTIVRIGSERDVQVQRFSPEAYGAEQFPLIKQDVETRAADAVELSAAIAADRKAAGEKYGVATSVGPVVPVKFTGVVGERKANYNVVAVEGLPAELTVRVQTGPALNGTDLRDATGQIEFGQFKNQIEYQDAGSAINNEVKKVVLDGIDPAGLSGKTVTVIGVFKLINPKSWIVTPVRLDVQ
jgi:predicted lipoprotein